MEKKVSKVEALPRLAPKFRVAAYARVSSEKDAMRHSLSAQVSYYSNLIQSHNNLGTYSLPRFLLKWWSNRPVFFQ